MRVKVSGNDRLPVYAVEDSGTIDIVLSQSEYEIVIQARALHEAAQRLLRKRIEEAAARRVMRKQTLTFYTGDDE